MLEASRGASFRRMAAAGIYCAAADGRGAKNLQCKPRAPALGAGRRTDRAAVAERASGHPPRCVPCPEGRGAGDRLGPDRSDLRRSHGYRGHAPTPRAELWTAAGSTLLRLATTAGGCDRGTNVDWRIARSRPPRAAMRCGQTGCLRCLRHWGGWEHELLRSARVARPEDLHAGASGNQAICGPTAPET